jgi:hypothetical protein
LSTWIHNVSWDELWPECYNIPLDLGTSKMSLVHNANTAVLRNRGAIETLTPWKVAILWYMALCSSYVNRRFEGTITYFFRAEYNSSKIPACSRWLGNRFSTLKMMVILPFDTSIHILTTRRYIPDGGDIQNYRCENLWSYIWWCCLSCKRFHRCGHYRLLSLIRNKKYRKWRWRVFEFYQPAVLGLSLPLWPQVLPRNEYRVERDETDPDSCLQIEKWKKLSETELGTLTAKK